MSHENLVRLEAERRGWSIERRDRELGALGVPCFVAPNVAGFCDIWVGTAENSDALQVSHAWQRKAAHVAQVRNLEGGLYYRSGEKLRDGVIGETQTTCTLSIKLEPKNREYDNAWEALNTYVRVVYAIFLSAMGSDANNCCRPYKFDILGDQMPEAVEWRNLLSKERLAIIGLGGVGAWIADFAVKSDAREVHAWDHDCIEPKNILRMPGALDPMEWIGQPKAKWFQQTYGRIHERIQGNIVKVSIDNVQEIIEKSSFAFVAVDCAEDRMMVCESLASASIPFVVTGISLARRHMRVTVSMRIVTGHTTVSSWKNAIPQVGQSGQDDYGSLDLPDVYSIAAGWAIQSWRKLRGQVWQDFREECVDYRAKDQVLIVREI